MRLEMENSDSSVSSADRGMRMGGGKILLGAVLLLALVGLAVAGCQADTEETASGDNSSRETLSEEDSAVSSSPQVLSGENSSAPSSTLNSITTTGRETTLASPDEAVIYVTVETRGEEAAAAVDENARQMKEVITRLEQEEVPEEAIQTSNVTVHPEGRHDPDTGRLIPEGYRARNTVEVTLTDLERVGDIYSAAVEAGANNVRGPEWRLADDSAAVRDALKKAARVARTKAEALAEAEGAQVGDALVIREESASVPPMYFEPTMGMAADAARVESVPVNPQDLQVRASVTVTFRLQH